MTKTRTPKIEQIFGVDYHVCETQADLDSVPDKANVKIVGEWTDVELNRNYSNVYIYGTAQVGYVNIYGTVKGNVNIYGTAQVGYVNIYGTVKGNVYISGTAQVGYVYIYGTVKGNVYISGTVKGNVNISGTAQVGNVYIYGTAQVGNVYIYGTAQVGYVNIYGTVKGWNINDKTNFKVVDNSLFEIDRRSTRKGFTIYKGGTVESIDKGVITRIEGYVAEKDGFTAHGETAVKAIADCDFKIVQKDYVPTPITLDDNIDLREFRLRTGACEQGAEMFCKATGIDINKTYKLRELMPIFEANNSYGLDRLKEYLV